VEYREKGKKQKSKSSPPGQGQKRGGGRPPNTGTLEERAAHKCGVGEGKHCFPLREEKGSEVRGWEESQKSLEGREWWNVKVEDVRDPSKTFKNAPKSWREPRRRREKIWFGNKMHGTAKLLHKKAEGVVNREEMYLSKEGGLGKGGMTKR